MSDTNTPASTYHRKWGTYVDGRSQEIWYGWTLSILCEVLAKHCIDGNRIGTIRQFPPDKFRSYLPVCFSRITYSNINYFVSFLSNLPTQRWRWRIAPMYKENKAPVGEHGVCTCWDHTLWIYFGHSLCFALYCRWTRRSVRRVKRLEREYFDYIYGVVTTGICTVGRVYG